MPTNAKIIVTTNHEAQLPAAQALAKQLNLPLVAMNQITPNMADFALNFTPERLQLQEVSTTKSHPICVDFLAAKLSFRLKHASKNNEIILKAVGIKNNHTPSVLDATAGLGQDAFLLAAKGCEVLMLERSAIIGALLQDGLRRYHHEQPTTIKLALLLSSAQDYLKALTANQPDVIYLDPMYPPRVKSALGKKNMRILHELVGADEDASEILTLALQRANKRVVVKRPKFAQHLGLIKPDIIFASNACLRYDVYTIR